LGAKPGNPEFFIHDEYIMTQSLLIDFSRATILCIGDVMLDRFVYGNVDRISPESPVPILKMNHDFTVVGGAGNVARNISSLGGKVIFLGVIGKDSAGEILKGHLDSLPNATAILFEESHRQTIQKTRFIAQGQQLLRVDEETQNPCSSTTQQQILDHCKKVLPECQALILSDYNKGIFSENLCQEIIQLAKGKVPIIVDPKGRHYGQYKGATVLTPNLKELTEVVGRPLKAQADMIKEGQSLKRELDVESILITQGSQGMTLLEGDKDPKQIPAQALEVYDVSGAGDTVVATLAAALASGASLGDASRLANVAAGIVVGKVGTATVSSEELESSFNHHDTARTKQKVLTLSQATDHLKEWRRLGLKVGFTNGCFDLLHLGHLHILQESAAACDKLVIGLNSDASVRRLKGETRPVQNQETRSQVLAALGMVDLVVIFDEETPYNLISNLLPDVLVKGADYTIDRVVGADIVQAKGGEVLLINLKEGHSTTSTVSRMKA